MKIKNQINLKNQKMIFRKFITVLTLFVATSIVAQTKNLNEDISSSEIKIQNFEIAVEVDSIEEIESTFKVEDFKDILKDTGKNEPLVFKIKCNGEKMTNGLKSHISYEVKGNTNDKKGFLKNIKKIRNAAIKYYKTK